MTELVAAVGRISVTYIKTGPDGERQVRIIGLTSKTNRQHIPPDRLRQLLDHVALCCEDVLTATRSPAL
jgi:hypothetical protein